MSTPGVRRASTTWCTAGSCSSIWPGPWTCCAGCGTRSDRGVLAVEDADLEGLFCDPDNDGFTFYRRMYAEVLARSGGDPGCGHRLPRYFREIGIRTHPCAEPLWKMIMKSGLVAGVQLRAGCG